MANISLYSCRCFATDNLLMEVDRIKFNYLFTWSTEMHFRLFFTKGWRGWRLPKEEVANSGCIVLRWERSWWHQKDGSKSRLERKEQLVFAPVDCSDMNVHVSVCHNSRCAGEIRDPLKKEPNWRKPRMHGWRCLSKSLSFQPHEP